MESDRTNTLELSNENPLHVSEGDDLVNQLDTIIDQGMTMVNDAYKHEVNAQLISDISKACAEANLDFQAVLNIIARRTAELIGELCMIMQLSEDGQYLRLVAYFHRNPQVLSMFRETKLNTWKGTLDTPVIKRLFSGEPIFMPEATGEQVRLLVPKDFWPFIDQFGISSLIMVPLRVKGEVIGTLALGRNQPCHPYTWADEVLLQDLADRAALEIENARLYQSVKENQDRLRALNVRLIKVQEAERRNIARKLHDEVGQLLTGLQITMKMSSRLPLEETRSRLDEAQKLVERLLDQVQTLSLDLRPTVLDDLGLALALSWQFERYTHQTGIQVQYDHRNIDRRFPSMIEAAAFRIVQEGLTNVARHAGVDKVSVRAWADDDLLGIQIEDQGTGFDVNSAMASHVSSGLSGMQEQAELLGGQLTIESSPGTGTLITVELPLRDIDGDNQDERDDNLAGG